MGPWKLLLLGLALACSQARPAEAGKIADLQADASTNQAVRLRGVVTFHDPVVGGTFVQDDTGAVELRAGTASIAAGQWLEIEGTLHQVKGRPVVEATRLSLVGEAPLPNPRALANQDPSDLHGQYVEFRVVARSVAPVPHSTYAQITIELWGRRALVLMQSSMVPNRIAASRILVRGVVVADEPLRIMAHSIETIEPPLPALPIEEALQSGSRLAQVQGTVIYKVNSRHFFLENSQYTVEVLTATPHDLAVGEPAEAIGFPRAAGLLVEDATAARLQSFETSAPKIIREIAASHHGRLVRLVGEVAAAEGNTLILSAHGSLLPTYAPSRTSLPRRGSQVEITGMARTNAFGPTLWLRDSRDIRLLSQPNSPVVPILIGIVAISAGILLFRKFSRR